MVWERSGSRRPARARPRRRPALALALGLGGVLLTAGCQSPAPFYRSGSGRKDGPVVGIGGPAPYVSVPPPPQGALALPGSSPAGARQGGDVYAATRRGMLTDVTRRYPPRVYVPDSESGTVAVIDQRTFRITHRLRIGGRPLSVIPAWDLRTLWAADPRAGALVPIDPLTARPGPRVEAGTPSGLSFTPDGRLALVMTERRIDFRDPRSWRSQGSLAVPCRGLGTGDFTADQTTFVAGCERSGQLVRVDPRRRAVTGLLRLSRDSKPQDVRLSPDGTMFYVADLQRHGVWLIDAVRFRKAGFLHTGPGAQRLYPSRDGGVLYVTHRGDGSVSLIDFAARRVVRRWHPSGVVSPEGGGVSADGRVLWLSGPGAVYAISTRTGRPLHTIKMGTAPRALCVYPQPGRFSLGHTGIYR